MQEQFPGIYMMDGSIYTENAVPGTQVYGESVVEQDDVEYRRWDPHRSKMAAAIKKGLQTVPVDQDAEMLYLGASTGTTASHFTDVLQDGIVYAVEYAPKIARDLVAMAENRDNVAPILGDARTPQDYRALCSTVDVIYQDVAQQNQIDILRRNAEMFLKDGGRALIAIKAQSISSSRPSEAVFAEAKEQLREEFNIVSGKKLAPFHTDHLFLVLERSL